MLADYAFFAAGLLRLFNATGDLSQIERALGLIEQVRKRFRHAQACFYETPTGHEMPMGRQLALSDWAVPSGNGILVDVLLQAASLTARRDLKREGETCLASVDEHLRRSGLTMAAWLDAQVRYLGPFYEVVIAGSPADPRTRALTAVIFKLRPSHALLIRVPATGPKKTLARLLPTTREKRALSGAPTAYVCQWGSCKHPTKLPGQLKAQLMAGWKH